MAILTICSIFYLATTTTTTTSTVGCSVSGSTTHAPGGQGGESVIYTFDNTPNDYYGNYNAVPVNSPQYVSPGYNGRGYAIQLLSAQAQLLQPNPNQTKGIGKSRQVRFILTCTPLDHKHYGADCSTRLLRIYTYPLAVYTGNPYVDMIIYAQTNSSTYYQYMWMMLRNGSNYGAFFGDDVWGPTLLQTNQWQHMAFTYNYSTGIQVVYVNGVAGTRFEDATNPNALPCLITAGVQTIGAYPGCGAGFFDGYIDQLEILFSVAKTATEILNDATLVGYYSMDCLSYSSLDSGPNQINGIAVGLSSGDGGRVGQSYLFNTNSSYFQVTGLVFLGQSYKSFSFALWLRPITSVTSGGTILHVSQTTTGTGWCVQFIGLSSLGQIVVNGYSSSGAVSVIGPVLTVGQWVHIVETYSQLHGVRLYVNGILYSQSSGFVYSSSGVPMTVTLGQCLSGTGCDHTGIQTGYYQGQIDEFYIYSRELAQADVTTLANP
ncbi:unnamed protein product [Rotaria socialis]|uniref:LamG-like jellyroll fold domain-containing protein n=1 Tax=Rotaria socialis TaxID=392032 RepID=A0A818XLB9_9BILA|nr:unnamed protein product [Rotaria socialis]